MTFNNYKGRNWFLHMPFSLKMSQDIFQMQITECLLGIIAIHDDFCIYSHTPEGHDRQPIHLMQTTTKNGMIFNSSKCRIWLPQISFYNTVFTPKGMKPNPTKVQVFQDLPTPYNQTKLQSFLGLINYLHPFFPGLDNKPPSSKNSLPHGIGTP